MEDRKKDHINICISKSVECGDTGFSNYKFRYKALPELEKDKIDTKTEFLGKKLEFPLIFEAITGGTEYAKKFNKTIAKIAQDYGLGMGVGSQRAAIEDISLASTYQVRDVAEDILLIGNLGAVQLNYGYGLDECEAAVNMIDADALALHLNPLQEAVQPEGNTDFKNLIGKINDIASEISVPIIVKEVGNGLDLNSASNLDVGALDCAGWGGTSWNLVESYRNKGEMGQVGRSFSECGIPTSKAISDLSGLNKPLIGSGGIRNGLDAAKAIALGADVAGFALPLLRKYEEGGEKSLRSHLNLFMEEFRTAMYVTGSKNISELKGKVI